MKCRLHNSASYLSCEREIQDIYGSNNKETFQHNSSESVVKMCIMRVPPYIHGKIYEEVNCSFSGGFLWQYNAQCELYKGCFLSTAVVLYYITLQGAPYFILTWNVFPKKLKNPELYCLPYWSPSLRFTCIALTGSAHYCPPLVRHATWY